MNNEHHSGGSLLSPTTSVVTSTATPVRKRSYVPRVCELLLGRPPLEEEGKSLVRMRGEVASRSSNPRGATAMNEGDGQIAQRGHGLRSRACAQARTIFAKGDIAHIMQAVLDAPMAPRQIEEASRTGLDGGEVGDEVDHLPSWSCPFCVRSRSVSSAPPDEPAANWQPDSRSCHN